MNQLSVVRDDPIFIDSQHPDEPEPQEPQEAQRPKLPPLAWDEGDPAASNYRKLGIVLAKSGDLFCRAGYEGGLLLVRPDGSSKSITTAADLAPIIVDRVALTIYLDGKPKGSKLSAAHARHAPNEGISVRVRRRRSDQHCRSIPAGLPANGTGVQRRG